MKVPKYNVNYVPVITLLSGFLSFISLSIYYKVFWIDSKYDVPLIYNASVMFGDSLLLPTLNYKIFNLSLNYIGVDKIAVYKKNFIPWLVVSLIISSAANISAHLFWVNDTITDFVGFEQGKFSVIGYWHLIYSIIQMLILFMFPFFWYIAIKVRDAKAVKYAHNIWKYTIVFSTLAIFDMLNKYWFIYKNKTLWDAMKIDKYFLCTLCAVLIMYVIMRNVEKKYLIK